MVQMVAFSQPSQSFWVYPSQTCWSVSKEGFHASTTPICHQERKGRSAMRSTIHRRPPTQCLWDLFQLQSALPCSPRPATRHGGHWGLATLPDVGFLQWAISAPESAIELAEIVISSSQSEALPCPILLPPSLILFFMDIYFPASPT